ncbi:MAG: hypothetical protein HQK54_08450, partial [Oligoflexales bacterium]|nr:hypothetical protein [Oligoflexales bacterium]
RDTELFDLNRIGKMLEIETSGANKAPERDKEEMANVNKPKKDEVEKSGKMEKPKPEPVEEEVYEILPEEHLACDCLKAYSSLGDGGIVTLKKLNLLKEKNFSKITTTKLASVLGISNIDAERIQTGFSSRVKERLDAEIAVKVSAMEKANGQLLAECERIIGENSAIIESNRILREKYDYLVSHNDEIEAQYKSLRSSFAAEQVEFNRLSLEISFLNDERQRLMKFIKEKDKVLGSMLHRYEILRNYFEFAKGETAFSKDRLDYLEKLLDLAVKKKKTLDEKVSSTQETYEKLYNEVNDVIKKGKRTYYEKITEKPVY